MSFSKQCWNFKILYVIRWQFNNVVVVGKDVGKEVEISTLLRSPTVGNGRQKSPQQCWKSPKSLKFQHDWENFRSWKRSSGRSPKNSFKQCWNFPKISKISTMLGYPVCGISLVLKFQHRKKSQKNVSPKQCWNSSKCWNFNNVGVAGRRSVPNVVENFLSVEISALKNSH